MYFSEDERGRGSEGVGTKEDEWRWKERCLFPRYLLLPLSCLAVKMRSCFSPSVWLEGPVRFFGLRGRKVGRLEVVPDIFFSA